MFLFDPRENIRKPLLFWCYQGNQKGNIGNKTVQVKSFQFLQRHENLNHQQKLLFYKEKGVYPWILVGIASLCYDVCISVLEIYVFSRPQKLSTEMTKVICQEIVFDKFDYNSLGIFPKKNLQFSRRKKPFTRSS